MNRFNISLVRLGLQLFLCGMFGACDKEEDYFNGEIHEFEWCNDSIVLQGENVLSEPLYSDKFSVKDSLLFSYSPQLTDYAFYVFNLNTKEFVDHFFSFGRGDGEYLGLGRIVDFFQENGDTKSLMYAPNERKIFVWNITQSLLRGDDVAEDFRETPIRSDRGLIYDRITKLHGDQIFAYTTSVQLYVGEDICLPKYYVFSGRPYEKEKEFSIVKANVKNPGEGLNPESYFRGVSRVKPDKNKFVEVMHWLPRLNIVDIATGNVDCYKLQDSPAPTFFETSMKNPTYYYDGVAATDHLIFALYAGMPSESFEGDCHWVHVFDWNGNLLNRIYLRDPATSMWLDEENHLLYTYYAGNETVMRYDMSAVEAEL